MLPVTAAGWTTAAAFGNPSKSMNGSTRRGFLSLMMSQSNGLFIDNAGARREIYPTRLVVTTQSQCVV